jgi:hypothetical protein
MFRNNEQSGNRAACSEAPILNRDLKYTHPDPLIQARLSRHLMNPFSPFKRLLGLIVTMSLGFTAAAFAAGKGKTVPRAKSPSSAAAKKPTMDPRDQPFTPDGRGMLREPFLPPGWNTDATFSGSIHSPLEFGNFFQSPEFKKKEHDGRLYFTNYLCREPHNTVAFVTWRPLNAKADLAQHICVRYGDTASRTFRRTGKSSKSTSIPRVRRRVASGSRFSVGKATRLAMGVSCFRRPGMGSGGPGNIR